MKKSYKIILSVPVFIISFFVFNLLEFEPLNQKMNTDFQSLVFSIILLVSVFMPNLRMKLFNLAFLLLLLMGGFYLLSQLSWANAFSSLGVGILLIVSLTYLPELLRRGTIENL